jgi:hypothetical protein
MGVLHIGLPKWPALLVSGKTVSREEAQEIIVRTMRLPVSTNDHKFKREIYDVLDVKYTIDEGYIQTDWDSIMTVCQKYGLLNISYLHNERVCSCWIGGPHGWCDWSGRIHAASYNIGKWPSVISVLGEWERIAMAFPWLELRSQLCSGEQCEEDIRPVVEFSVKDGKAEAYFPTGTLVAMEEHNIEEETRAICKSTSWERGCTIDEFAEAVAVTAKRLNSKCPNCGGEGAWCRFCGNRFSACCCEFEYGRDSDIKKCGCTEGGA